MARLDRHGYLFGQKITHSLSPFLHQIIYDHLGLKWSQIRLDSADMSQFLQLAQHPSFYGESSTLPLAEEQKPKKKAETPLTRVTGASVTMPNKVAILSHLDEMTDECRDVGACNTLFLKQRNGHRILCGTNTDVVGIRDSFHHNVADPSHTFHGRPALVIGGGGAARSAIYALRKWMHVTDIYLVNRDKGEVDAMVADCCSRGYGHGLRHVASVDEARAVDGPGAIVACVPDCDPQTREELVARQVAEVLMDKRHKGAMLEMCYNPSPFTRLGALAGERGWQVILGTEALVWQGLEQDRYWTGLRIDQLPVDKVQEAIGEKVAQRSQSRL